MSKMVVGMNIRPAMKPQRMDCGLRKTVRMPRAALRSQSLPPSAFSAFGMSARSSAPITRPATPMTTQKRLQGTPEAITGPTTNWPAEPPAMPNICVAPMRVAAIDAGKLFEAM